jgi:hypothetical protein
MAVARTMPITNRVLHELNCDEIIAVYGPPDIVEARSGNFYSWLVSERPLCRIESNVVVEYLETEFKYYYHPYDDKEVVEQYIKPLYKNKTAVELLALLA